MTGGTLDSATGLYKITPAAYAKLKSLFFTINGVRFSQRAILSTTITVAHASLASSLS